MDSIVDDVEGFEEMPWGSVGRALTLGFVCLCNKFVMHVLNKTTCVHKEIYTEAVMQREKDVGLVTVSNHTR